MPTILFVAAIVTIFAVLFAYVAVPYIFAVCSRIVLVRKVVQHKGLVLTFDDGPGSKLTPTILDVLNAQNVKATFFLLGSRIQGREEIVRRMVRDGHEICSHGNEHINYLRVSPFRAVKDIDQGWRAIDTALGVHRGMYPFRPPYGKLNLICLLYLLLCRAPIIYWSMDLQDTFALGPDPWRLTRLLQRGGGAVILVHDFDRKDDARAQLIIDSVRVVLETARKAKMQIMTVSEFLNAE